MRAETGPMEFDDDWKGVFIRGDNAMGYVMYLQIVKETLDNLKDEDKVFGLQVVDELIQLMSSSNQFSNIKTQQLKKFEDCVMPKSEGD